MKFTIFGGGGFIGQNLSRYLEDQGHKVWMPSRAAAETRGQDLGHVIYAIGLTGDFRSRPFDTVDAHVCKLLDMLMSAQFDSWLYLSSTRIYGGLPFNEVAREDMALNVSPSLDGVYNISKLMGEALCLSLPNKHIRVVRISNVYGCGQSEHTFLASIVDELVKTGNAIIREAPESAKDYIALADVLPLLEAIALSGRERIYNLASGKGVTHAELANKLIKLTGCAIQFEEKAPCRRFPLIDISRIQNEFDFVASGIDDNLPALIATNAQNRKKENTKLNKNALDPVAAFKLERAESISRYPSDKTWQTMSGQWVRRAFEQKYMYNFESMGRPIIQTPIDMVAMQELIWQVKPDLIIETGIAHGGSLILSASMLAMIDYCEAVESGKTLAPKASRRRVLGLDIDIRAYNRAAIEAHPLAHKIDMFQGSSIAPDIIAQVHEHAKGYERILVCLDSMHTHEHVLAELEAYAPLVSLDSYCVVFDTIIEDMPDDMFPDRPWGRGNNPKTAVWEYLRCLKEEGRTATDGAPLHFEIDKMIENKLLITVAPDGYLKRIS